MKYKNVRIMEFNLSDEISELYEKWLLEYHPEDVPNKDALIEASCDGLFYDDFMEEVKKVL